MYNKKYVFYHQGGENRDFLNGNTIPVNCKELYSKERTYGFITEENRGKQEELQLPELNSGFEPYYWLKGEEVTKLTDTDKGVSTLSGAEIPICFKCKVPKQGNYFIRVTLTALETAEDIVVFAGRRRLAGKKKKMAAGEVFIVKTLVNISNIIPRGRTECYEDTSLDIAALGSNIAITEIYIEERGCPTFYIGGDSTVTDQGAAYPYKPGCSYCGWGQMLSFYLKDSVAVSNHAHSGLTTVSFRSEGHYDIVRKLIKPGDFFFLQFAHNDQKLPALDANGGYRSEILKYLKEMKKLGVIPVLVTPLARNTWKGDGSYNDLLEEYAKVCKEIGEKEKVLVFDLHSYSKKFVIRLGVEDAARYYFPKDYTHSNDYGGFLMAQFIAKAALEAPALKDFINKACISDGSEDLLWLPPAENILPTAPEDFAGNNLFVQKVEFKDIENASEQKAIKSLAKDGIITGATEKFRPGEYITRAEALNFIVKGVRFVPTEVYNDRYEDVVGHEWYAGIVETAFQNDIVPVAMTAGGKLQPLEVLYEEEFIVFCINSYKCRKQIKGEEGSFLAIRGASEWAMEAIKAASKLGIISDGFIPRGKLTRDKAAGYLKKLVDLL